MLASAGFVRWITRSGEGRGCVVTPRRLAESPRCQSELLIRRSFSVKPTGRRATHSLDAIVRLRRLIGLNNCRHSCERLARLSEAALTRHPRFERHADLRQIAA